MRMSERRSSKSVAFAERLQVLAAAFAEFRKVNKRGRRIPTGLRAQVVAALRAGVSASAIERACGVSWSQLTYWRSAAASGGQPSAAPEAQVLSVVDAGAPGRSPVGGGVELRVGPWRISLSRMVE
jgi:hypothetical protein